MGFTKRKKLYEELERVRERPLIVYVTSTRPGVESKMLPLAVPELLDQLNALPKDAGKLDLLVVSNGGDPMMAWRTMTLIHERVNHVAVLVPQVAYSAATMLAMGAHEIVMHPNGNLGPVDPQIEVAEPGKPSQRFGFEDLASFLEFAEKEVGLTEQEQKQRMFAMFCRQVGPVPVAIAARSTQLTEKMGTKLLMLHMEDQAKAEEIAKALNKKFFNHGYPVSRREARDDIGLAIAERDETVEDLMWQIWLDIEKELEVRKPFNPLHHILAEPDALATLLGPVSQAKLPANAPPQMLQLINNIQLSQGKDAGAIVKGLLDATATNIKAVDFSLTTGIIESARKGSSERMSGKVLACRMPDLNIRLSLVTTSTGWYPHSQ